jgi:hypothetical protein
MTLVVILAAIGLLGSQTAMVWWLVSKAFGGTDRVVALVEDLGRKSNRIDELGVAIGQRDAALEQLRGQCDREAAARAVAEKHRDVLLQDLARSGDPRALAAAVQRELSALSRLSGASAPAAGAGETAVHGSATPDP